MGNPPPRAQILVKRALLAAAVALATCLLAAQLFPSLRLRAPAGVHVAKELPAWKPGPGWLSATPESASGPDGRLSLPLYPPFTDEQATQLFLRTRGEGFDELCGDRWLPHLDDKIPFADYPGGAFQIRTNSLGMREDADPSAKKPALRVLVTGDSHTDGVCANAESFPNLLEKLLINRGTIEARAREEIFDAASIEVLNAGKGAYSFYNYLGVLERYLDLAPDVFLVAVYGGNDFEEALSVWHFYFNRGQRPRLPPDQIVDLSVAERLHVGATAQGLYSVRYFATHPDQLEVATRAACDVLDKLQALCKERGIRLVVAYLPSWMEVAPDDPALGLDELLASLHLQRADMGSTTRMADALLAHLGERRVTTVDLRPAFAASKERLYWTLDCHLGLAGHRLAASELAPVLSRR